MTARSRRRRSRQSGKDDDANGSTPKSPPSSPQRQQVGSIAIGIVLLMVFGWAYWPTLLALVAAWDRDPDYSHGYLVLPLALFFLWARRNEFPGTAKQWAWWGLALIAASVGMRYCAGLLYNDSIDAWSIIPWTAGVVLLLGGWPLLKWSLPSIAFLWFMAPLPFRVEKWLSLPLQRVATLVSSWTLQFLGQPALAEGNTIILREHTMEVEEACSGLRIFVGIFALAFAYVVLARRPWWQRALLIASALPIAIVANATRIVGTGLLFEIASAEAAHKFIHDAAGWVMIPFAAILFALTLFYLDRLFREVELVGIGDVVRSGRS